MSATHLISVGNKGRVVVPAEIRERHGLETGSMLVMLDSGSGLVLLTREQLRDRVRADLSGLDLVSELLEDRRTAAAGDDGR